MQRLQVSRFSGRSPFNPMSRSPAFLWLAPATMAIGKDTPILPTRAGAVAVLLIDVSQDLRDIWAAAVGLLIALSPQTQSELDFSPLTVDMYSHTTRAPDKY